MAASCHGVSLFLVAAYSVYVVSSVLARDDYPPAFDARGDLLVDGAEAVVISIASFVVPSVVLTATVSLPVLAFPERPGGAIVSIGFALLGLSIGGVLSLVCWYVGSTGLVIFAKAVEFGAAFAAGDFKPILTSGVLATAWLPALDVLVGSSTFAGIPSSSRSGWGSPSARSWASTPGCRWRTSPPVGSKKPASNPDPGSPPNDRRPE